MNSSLSLAVLFLLASGTFSSEQKTSQIEDPEIVQILPEAEENTKAVSYREPKLFPLLKLYSNFPIPSNTKCTTPEGEDGHCLKRTQCKAINGGVQKSTTCAKGLGICCVIELKLGENNNGGTNKVAVKHSPTHLKSGGGRVGVFEIPKQKDVCQLRLDFKDFNLAQPMVGIMPDQGKCVTDMMTITGAQNLERFGLCGNATGQHVYLHYGESELIKIAMDIGSTASSYHIQLTMIKCNSLDRAPEDCTQYYTNSRAEVRSFNYPRQHLNDQRYTVCIKSDDTTSVEWINCPNVADPFFVSGINLTMNQVASPCKTDYVTIPGSVGGQTSPIYCGGLFPNTVRSFAKPYTLYVNFDSGEPELGELQADGCYAGSICGVIDPGLPFPGVVICPNNLTPGVCSCNCVSPFGGSNPMSDLDLGNTGFCLQYLKG